MFIIVYWLGSDRPSDLLYFSYPLYFHTHAFFTFVICFFRLISFLLFPCASIRENARAWVSHVLNMLNGICSFPPVLLRVYILEIRCEKVKIPMLLNLCLYKLSDGPGMPLRRRTLLPAKAGSTRRGRPVVGNQENFPPLHSRVSRMCRRCTWLF